jgi:hypothetical protein
MKLRPFTKCDWYGYAGAEPFADGSDPLTADDFRVDGYGTSVLLDADGLTIQALCDGGEEIAVIHFPSPFAARAVALLGDEVSFAILAAMPGADVDYDAPKGTTTLTCIHCEHGDHDQCPGCGCEPGDGITPGCDHPGGCGVHALHAALV